MFTKININVLFPLCGYIALLTEATEQQLNLPACNITALYENSVLELEKTCVNDADANNDSYNFFLYLAEKERCQWARINRHFSTVCKFRDKSSSKRYARAVFKHVYGGAYCLAVYHGEWTSTVPLCSSETPFYLNIDVKELNVQLWNPVLSIQQNSENVLTIHFATNQSDGFDFRRFVIELFIVDENITNCDQLFYSSALETFDVENASSHTIHVNNVLEGLYCAYVTPIDPRCQFPFSTTYLPCTRSSSLTRVRLLGPKDSAGIPWIVIAIVAVLLSSCFARIIILLRRKNKRKDDATLIDSLQPSVFLLHSNDSQLTRCFQNFKNTLSKRLPSCQIEDYTDEDHWESVAEEGVIWFLSRLNNNSNTYILVIEPASKQRSSRENSFFLSGVHHLQLIASTSARKQVLFTWLTDNSQSKREHLQLEYPFDHFFLPRDWDVLIQRLRTAPNDYH